MCSLFIDAAQMCISSHKIKNMQNKQMKQSKRVCARKNTTSYLPIDGAVAPTTICSTRRNVYYDVLHVPAPCEAGLRQAQKGCWHCSYCSRCHQQTRTLSCSKSERMQGGPVSINKHPHGVLFIECTSMLASLALMQPGRQETHEPESQDVRADTTWSCLHDGVQQACTVAFVVVISHVAAHTALQLVWLGSTWCPRWASGCSSNATQYAPQTPCSKACMHTMPLSACAA